MNTYKKTCCGGFQNTRKDILRKHMAQLAFEQLSPVMLTNKVSKFTISCPGLRKNEHEVVSYAGLKDYYIGAEKDSEICAENSDLIQGDVLEVLSNMRAAGYPKPSILDLDIYKHKVSETEAKRIADAAHKYMSRWACIRFTVPLRANKTPTKTIEKALRRKFRITSMASATYKGGKDGHGVPMGIFQFIIDRG